MLNTSAAFWVTRSGCFVGSANFVGCVNLLSQATGSFFLRALLRYNQFAKVKKDKMSSSKKPLKKLPKNTMLVKTANPQNDGQQQGARFTP